MVMAARKSTFKMEKRKGRSCKRASLFFCGKGSRPRTRDARRPCGSLPAEKSSSLRCGIFSTSSLAARYAVTAAPCSKKKGKPLAGRNLTKYKRHGKDRLQDDARHRTVAAQPPSERRTHLRAFHGNIRERPRTTLPRKVDGVFQRQPLGHAGVFLWRKRKRPKVLRHAASAGVAVQKEQAKAHVEKR